MQYEESTSQSTNESDQLSTLWFPVAANDQNRNIYVVIIFMVVCLLIFIFLFFYCRWNVKRWRRQVQKNNPLPRSRRSSNSQIVEIPLNNIGISSEPLPDYDQEPPDYNDLYVISPNVELGSGFADEMIFTDNASGGSELPPPPSYEVVTRSGISPYIPEHRSYNL